MEIVALILDIAVVCCVVIIGILVHNQREEIESLEKRLDEIDKE